MSYFWASGSPVLDFLVMSPLAFKARVGSALFACFYRSKFNGVSAEVGIGLGSYGQYAHRRRTRYHCASDLALSVEVNFIHIQVFTCSGVRVAFMEPMSVFTQPGQTEITKIPSLFNSTDCCIVVIFRAA